MEITFRISQFHLLLQISPKIKSADAARAPDVVFFKSLKFPTTQISLC